MKIKLIIYALYNYLPKIQERVKSIINGYTAFIEGFGYGFLYTSNIGGN